MVVGRNTGRTALLFLAPTLLGLLIFKVYPIFAAFYGSFFAHSMRLRTQVFVYFEQYQSVFSDPIFWRSLWTTIVFNVVTIPLQVALSLGLALLLNAQYRSVGLMRSLIMFPVGISMPVTTVIWGVILSPQMGFANSMLGVFGIDPQPFLVSARQALPSIIWIATWKGVPYWMLFLLAGLKAIPEMYYECARLDGARPFTVLWRITIPLLERVLLFVIAANTIANFLLFVPPYLLTRGGPQGATNLLMYEVFKTGFIYRDMNRSLAMLMVLLVMLFVVILVQFRLVRAKHEY